MSTKGLNRNQRVEAYWSGDGATSDLHGGMAPSGRSTRGRGRKEGRDDVGRKKLTPQHSSLLHSAREDSSTSRKDLVRQPGCAVDASCQSVAMESHALSHLVSSPGPSCTLVASQSESCEMPPRPVFQADPVVSEWCVCVCVYLKVQFEVEICIFHIAITTWLEAVSTAVFLVTHYTLDFGAILS